MKFFGCRSLITLFGCEDLLFKNSYLERVECGGDVLCGGGSDTEEVAEILQ